MVSAYADLLERKRYVAPTAGVSVSDDALHPLAFAFQRDVTRWSLRKGRAANFAATGMGKTLMQLDWARNTGERTLIVAPLGVARQTVTEAGKWGIPTMYARHQDEAKTRIVVTNYEMVDHFDPHAFGAVVLDESSILKSFEGKVRTKLIERFKDVPLRLCCTATPAPNDISEIANHAEFLGLMTRADMMAAFFVHDDDGWRLKGHAREPFFRWLSSWALCLTKPSDLGYSDEGYILPPLDVRPIVVRSGYVPDGQLFHTGLKGIGDRTKVRKSTVDARVDAAVEIISREPNEQWLVWCGLNEEGQKIARAIPGAVLVEGSDTPDYKANALEAFGTGHHRVMVTKSSIAGFGLNFQSCSRMIFLGLNDSWEQYFQAIRRCWRFGQKNPVQVYVVISDAEEPVYQNVLRKDAEAQRMTAELVAQVAEFEREELHGIAHATYTEPVATEGKNWGLICGDAVEVLATLPEGSVDLTVSSPPFLSLYTYSASERDIGNCRTEGEFSEHFGFVASELLRVTAPGRLACIHVAQVPSLLSKDGVIGLKDFRGLVIELFQRTGWVYHGEVCIDKDPQAQAIRTHSKALLFAQLRKDASWLRPALADYVLVFRKPGDGPAIHPDLTNDEWIEWARPIWYGIRESDTLQVAPARSQEDERHICPLQLGTIERCIRLWSNAGDTVLDPFAGIGSTPYQAVKLGRRGLGVELKPEYFKVAAKNLERAAHEAGIGNLFASLEVELPAQVDSAAK